MDRLIMGAGLDRLQTRADSTFCGCVGVVTRFVMPPPKEKGCFAISFVCERTEHEGAPSK